VKILLTHHNARTASRALACPRLAAHSGTTELILAGLVVWWQGYLASEYST